MVIRLRSSSHLSSGEDFFVHHDARVIVLSCDHPPFLKFTSRWASVAKDMNLPFFGVSSFPVHHFASTPCTPWMVFDTQPKMAERPFPPFFPKMSEAVPLVFCRSANLGCPLPEPFPLKFCWGWARNCASLTQRLFCSSVGAFIAFSWVDFSLAFFPPKPFCDGISPLRVFLF